MLKSFEEIEEKVRSEKPKTIAVAMAQDKDVLVALETARSRGFTKAILTGNKEKIILILDNIGADISKYDIIDISGEREAIEEAISLVREGTAQVLMKGLCATSIFLQGVLDKQNGLRSGKVISHLAIFESVNYHKLFMMSDAAMNIAPDLSEKIHILENAIAATQSLGYKEAKVAVSC